MQTANQSLIQTLRLQPVITLEILSPATYCQKLGIRNRKSQFIRFKHILLSSQTSYDYNEAEPP